VETDAGTVPVSDSLSAENILSPQLHLADGQPFSSRMSWYDAQKLAGTVRRYAPEREIDLAVELGNYLAQARPDQIRG